MEVLKQISPTLVPVAPKDWPSKILPSSRARRARMLAQFPFCAPVFKFFARKILSQKISQHERKKNTRTISDPGALNYYPTVPFRRNTRSLSVTADDRRRSVRLPIKACLLLPIATKPPESEISV